MRLDALSLSNVRNYAALDFEPGPGLNVFVGANAQGKSNLLEAISLLGTGKSFRTSRESDLIRSGFELATISGQAHVRAGAIRLGCTITNTGRGTRKMYTVNGQSVRYARFLGSIKVVTFIPADLQLVGGPPSLRRAFVNGALAQDEPLYYRALAQYQKALAQKSALLRGTIAPDPQLLAIYDNTLLETGTQLMLARRQFVAAVATVAQRVHAQWTHGAEHLDVQYEPNVTFDVPTADAVGAAFEARQREVAPAEAIRKSVLAGPHRDDLGLALGGASLAAYGSQGQQRTAVLALKVAEYVVMSERCAEAPLLLLDDVLSELDAERAQAFLDGVGAYEQAFITATHLPRNLPGARVYEIATATLREVA